jgi:hypothetical protein
MLKKANDKVPLCVACGRFPVRARGLCARCYLQYWRAHKPFPQPSTRTGKWKDPA